MANEKRLIDALGLVIKLAKKVGIMVRNGKPQAEIYSKVLEYIAEAPTVDAVEVVHGRWEDVGDNISDLCFRCSACKEEYSAEINMNTFARYCPNCGAKMDGGNEDE